jgi:hypothetical protein
VRKLQKMAMVLNDDVQVGLVRTLRHPDIDSMPLYDDELVLVLQPVVDLATGAPTELEALARWHHPRRGLLPPAEFVRVVENSDLLARFTEYVIDKALAAAARVFRLAVVPYGRRMLHGRTRRTGASFGRRHRSTAPATLTRPLGDLVLRRVAVVLRSIIVMPG